MRSPGAHPMELLGMSHGTFLGFEMEVEKALLKNDALPVDGCERETANVRGRPETSSLTVEYLHNRNTRYSLICLLVRLWDPKSAAELSDFYQTWKCFQVLLRCCKLCA